MWVIGASVSGKGGAIDIKGADEHGHFEAHHYRHLQLRGKSVGTVHSRVSPVHNQARNRQQSPSQRQVAGYRKRKERMWPVSVTRLSVHPHNSTYLSHLTPYSLLLPSSLTFSRLFLLILPSLSLLLCSELR